MCAVSCFFLLYFTWSEHFLLRQIHISVLFGYICMRFLESAFLTALDSYFCAFWLYLHAFYLAAASTSSALLDIPSLQSHIVIFENKSIIQQQHSHSMVFVIFSIEFTQNKNKTCLRIFTLMLFDQQLQPQIIL